MLSAEGLSCGYGGPDVLSDVTLRVAAGEFVAVAGPNGAGKSTLLRALSRVLPPRAGSVRLEDRDLYSIPSRESALSIAVVPQESPIDFEFTAQEVVLMGRAPRLGRFQSERPGDLAAARSAMERTGTWELRDRSIVELSGGERQRVILARAFAQEPRILILDEPTAHLDLAFQVQILRLVRASRVAAVAALHDLNLAAAYADRILLLAKGRVAAEGSAEQVLTEELLRRVYETDLRVERHPETGRPLVLVRP